MNFKALLVVTPSRHLFTRFREIALHHGAIQDIRHIPFVEDYIAILSDFSEPVVVVENGAESVGGSLRRVTPTHMSDQVGIIRTSLAIESPLNSGEESFDVLVPETLSYLQFDSVISELGERIAERLNKRFSSAVRLLAREVGGQLDQIAFLQHKGYSAEVSKAIFRDMASSVKELTKEEQALFLKSFLEYCEYAAAPHSEEVSLSGPYRGVSNRIRKRQSAKAANNFQQIAQLKKKIALG
ncbi:MAG: hypothetical protein KDD70_09980 [Bdellovibrionales bacterium]|nr:hypothetical protein [Bdellovibrionales bacterium]